MTTQDSDNEVAGDPTVTPFRDVNAETMQRRIADDLRQARLARGLEIREAADALRIRAVYLEALEESRFGDLPGPTYVAGFLRTYGDFLRLDGEELVRRYKDDTGGVLAQQQLNFPVPASEARQPTLAYIVVALLIGVVIFGAWYAYREGMLVDFERVPEVPAVIESGDADMADADSAGEDAVTSSADMVGGGVVSEPAAPAETAQDAGSADSDVTTAGLESMEKDALGEAAVLQETDVQEVAADAPEVAEVAVPSSDEAEANDQSVAMLAETEAELSGDSGYVPRIYGRTNADSRVEIRATEETWIQVEAPDNEILLTRVLLPGDVYRVPNRSDVTLDTGNAGGLEVKVDGEVIGPLGEPGIVVRNVSLSADELLSR